MEKKITYNLKYIKNRILYFASYKGISFEKFTKNIGMSYASFKGEAKKSTINSDAIVNIITNYPDINPIWLLTGQGEMVKIKDDDINKDELAVVALVDNVRMQKKLSVYEIKVKRLEELNDAYKDEIRDLKNEISLLNKK